MKVTIIGDGGWGTALGLLLHGYGHAVTIWGPFEEYLSEIRAAGVNRKFLPDVPLPGDLRWTADPAAAMRGAELAVLAMPSRYYGDVCARFRESIASAMPLVSVTKGLCEQTHRVMSALAREALGARRVAVLSGPSLAAEVARQLPTAVVAASDDAALAATVQRLFSGPRFRVYTSNDPLGVELGGALKNVIAVAVGVSDGLGFGDNTRAALITRGLAEMTRLGSAMGARPETFAGLSGMGDLIVTCSSTKSRNHAVGMRLGRGESIGTILDGMQMVAEGVWNSHIVYALAQEAGVEMPISALVHRFCDEGLSPHDAVEELMGRESKAEAVR
ncbi:MAG: NAD(P)-dependent glycerol-3-phosphate dehydrogenase [Kiritimatiellae bacterium]|nr:NAD(P)-dependent glycerol-3-phosphate dehydrogenase [Kiritimatiellia bacterium]